VPKINPAAARAIPKRTHHFLTPANPKPSKQRHLPPKNQIVSRLARRNDESALFYGHLDHKSAGYQLLHFFVAMQQIHLDDRVDQAHIAHVAVQ
jgi:hypothetical protein